MDKTFTSEINLLYVEDDIDIRTILSRRLQRVVKQLTIAENGQDGYEKFLECKPDLIITDITMPKLNGIEMSRKIREINKDIPIIVVSAHADSKFLLDAIDSGVTGYLIKPIDREKLYGILESQAKTICLERINIKQQKQLEEQKVILQNIINAEKSIAFVTDFKKLSFANSSFLNFFNVKDIQEFEERFKNIEDIFLEHEDFMHKGKVIDSNESFAESFYNKLEKMDETKRVTLMLSKTLDAKSFFINISIIDKEKNLFLIHLTDITKMTIEKINTEQKAYSDGLTGVYNRNKFEERFKQELSRAKRYGSPFSIAILDIDHFKNFNDSYGHLIGDEVLILIAQEIDQKVRTTDMFARWGGEEFIVLFTETKLGDAINTVEKLRTHVQQIEHKTAGSITASFGVTEYKEHDTLESIFKRCDEALYEAKEKGRNRVEFK